MSAETRCARGPGRLEALPDEVACSLVTGCATRPSEGVQRLGRIPTWNDSPDSHLRPAKVTTDTYSCSRVRGSQTMRVLVVEDEEKMATLIRRGLADKGMAVDVCERGEDALWRATATVYDAIVLDVMLPGIDGFETCERLRAQGVWSPVLMLTARDGVEDRVAGLDRGADDYLTKPFSFTEFSARLRALARRGQGERPAILEVGSLRLDPAGRRVWRADREIPLSAKEYAVLEVFMRRPDEVLTRFQLLEAAWDDEYENRSNVIDVYVRYLREKIDRPFGCGSLETVRGAGYRLRSDAE